jgi:inorganic pyrophosphatase
MTLALITHFFEHYKDLERGKWVKVGGWVGPEEAKKEIVDGIASYRKAKKKPAF